jgi:hypothetical protein
MATDQPLIDPSTSSTAAGVVGDGPDVQRRPGVVSPAKPNPLAKLRSAPNAVSQLLDDVVAAATSGLQQINWAETEIQRASAEHPAHADHLFHAFRLLTPTADVMRTEFVYSSHCRELLARVVAGHDTRAATNAEIAAACSEASLIGPLNLAGLTVYLRAWTAAFPDKLDVFGDADPYEYVAGSDADVLERQLCRRLTVEDRTLRGVTCSGRHHGEPAPTCRYFTPEQLNLPVAAGEDSR